MRVLITGGTGLLGKALIETNKDLHRIWAIYLGNYNVLNNKEVTYFNIDICHSKNALENIFFKAKPEVVVHTAGIANVDYCQNYYDKAWYSNVYGTKIIISFCKKYNSKIVFISTNAIFDGKNAPYSEEDIPSPINNYGRMKLEAEEFVKNSGLRYIIVRPILMYGWNNKNERLNSTTWLIGKLSNREMVNIVNDIYENPLFNLNCAEVIWALIKLDKEGFYHIAGREVVNRYEFAKAVAEIFCFNQDLIHPVSSDFFPNLAPRPHNTSYSTAKIEKELDIKLLDIKEGLLLMKQTQEE